MVLTSGISVSVMLSGVSVGGRVSTGCVRGVDCSWRSGVGDWQALNSILVPTSKARQNLKMFGVLIVGDFIANGNRRTNWSRFQRGRLQCAGCWFQ